MTRSCLLLAAAICVGLGSPVQAQTAKIQREVEDKLRERRLHEDVEIMRRLLNRSLLSVATFGSGRANDSVWLDMSHSMGMHPSRVMPHLAHTYSDLANLFLGTTIAGKGGTGAPHHALEGEGTYLKGQGVLFTMTLPRPVHDPRPEPIRPAAKPLSDWEILRRELRGEKVEGEGDRREKREPRVADVVLMLLAENGKHLVQLAPDEQVTVAITFRGHQCAACHGGSGSPSRIGDPMGGGPGGMMPGGGLGTGGSEMGPGAARDGRGTSGLGVPGGAGVGPTPGGGEGPGGGSPDAGGGAAKDGNPYLSSLLSNIKNQMLLGDLKYRQNQYREAMQAYQEAVDMHDEIRRSLSLFANTSRQQCLQTHLVGAELHGKLVQTYLFVGEKDKAQKALVRVAEEAKKAEHLMGPTAAAAGKPTPKPDGEVPIPLASKLVISAPKKLLDQVGQGKMTFEEFKKAATVEYLTFEAEAKP